MVLRMGEIPGDFYNWDKDSIEKVPARPGVYGLYDAGRNLIYIGSSSNLRGRFTDYWNSNFAEDPCKRSTKAYKMEFRDDYELRERGLLEQYRSEHGNLPKCNEKILARVPE